jgi:hypothetical protein
MSGSSIVSIPAGANIGVADRSAAVWQVFCRLARGDFHHDFNDDRARVKGDDGATLLAFAKQIGSTKGKVWWLTRFKELVTQTPVSLYGNNINLALPYGEFPDGWDSEEGLMKLVGIDYSEIKNLLKPGDVAGGPMSFQIPDTGIVRNYDIRASLYKNPDGTTKNISHIFREVTGAGPAEEKEIFLLVDAVTGLSTSEFLNNSLTPQTNGCNFYIIENIENTSDSATKITNLKETPVLGLKPANLSYLRDVPKSVSYPLWEGTGEDQRTNIFSKLDIVLKRVGDDRVDGDIVGTLNDGAVISTTIEDLSTAANVKNASFAMIATALEKGIGSEAIVYALTKRMGDWCQALSLLDLEREYAILDKTRSPTGGTLRLGEVISLGGEVGILTVDRVVLAFGILLGLNVFFTTGTDVRKLVYFKNREGGALNPTALSEKADAIVEALGEEVIFMDADGKEVSGNEYTAASYAANVTLTTVYNAIGAYEQAILDAPTIFRYIFLLRTYVANVGRVVNTTFNREPAGYTTAGTNYNAALAAEGALAAAVAAARTAEEANAAAAAEAVNTSRKFQAANDMFSIVASLKIERELNVRVLADLSSGRYAGVESDTNFLNMLETKATANLRVTAAEAAVRDIILDMREAVRTFPNPEALYNLISSYERFTGPPFPTLPNVFKALDALRAVLPPPTVGGGRQRGGGAKDTYQRIRRREIMLLMGEETTSTPNAYTPDDVFVTSELNRFSISDEYIVTNDDYDAFTGAFDNLVDDYETRYVALKYLLMKCDMCGNQINNLLNASPRNDGLDTYNIDEVTPDIVEVWRRIKTIEEGWGRGGLNINEIINLYNDVYVSPRLIVKPSLIPKEVRRICNNIIGSIRDLASKNIVVFVDQNHLNAIARESQEVAPAVRPDNYSLRVVTYISEVVPALTYTDLQRSQLSATIVNALKREMEGALSDDFAPRRLAEVVVDALAPYVGKRFINAKGRWQWEKGKLTNEDMSQIAARVRGVRSEELDLMREELEGGLRKRRSLYSNASNPHALPVRPPSDEGLRERRRTRRAPRVRQSAGKSRRRRQRDDLDRV